MNHQSKIFIAGHKGMVGSAIVRKLEQKGYKNLVVRTSKELDLREQRKVEEFFQQVEPEYVFLAAARVGGIVANNTFRAEFLYDNLTIQGNVIHQAYKAGVKKLLFLGSSCIYPKMAPQPLKEEFLLSGLLEPTNEPYAVAKIAGIKMCDAYRNQYGCNFISAMPTNLSGPNDNYDLDTSHVIPALLRKFHEARSKHQHTVSVWGTGKPLREFLHVDDLAEACLFLMEKFNEPGFINVGTGIDRTIKELAELISRIVDYTGRIEFDTSKPDGTPRKLMDVSKIRAMGWTYSIELEEGLRNLYSHLKKDGLFAHEKVK